MKSFNRFMKRGFDIISSLIGIILLSPILIVISIIIKTTSKGPVLFRQRRVGKDEKIFEIFKFRTMVVNAENLGTQITIGEDKRITSIGKFLRKYKLDELPQLFNVFLGQMSLVGPRPEVPKYVEMYTSEQRMVLSVRPGITDYASLKYSDENDLLGKVEDPENYYINVIMQDKLKLNLEYIKDNNVFNDIKIIFQTILKCL